MTRSSGPRSRILTACLKNSIWLEWGTFLANVAIVLMWREIVLKNDVVVLPVSFVHHTELQNFLIAPRMLSLLWPGCLYICHVWNLFGTHWGGRQQLVWFSAGLSIQAVCNKHWVTKLADSLLPDVKHWCLLFMHLDSTVLNAQLELLTDRNWSLDTFCSLTHVLIVMCRYLASPSWRVTERFVMTKASLSVTLPEQCVITRYWRLFSCLNVTWKKRTWKKGVVVIISV